MGTPIPEVNYIASDADYITELLGGFAIPYFLKECRKGKQCLFHWHAINRDSKRMVMSDIVHGAAEQKGWVLRKNSTDKEQRFCKKIGRNNPPYSSKKVLILFSGFKVPYRLFGRFSGHFRMAHIAVINGFLQRLRCRVYMVFWRTLGY